MSKPIGITLIICTYNRADYLSDTLASLLKGNSPIHPVEILVVDNNSSDETAAVVKRYRHMSYKVSNITVRYVEEKKQGLSHARNRGIKEATTSVVVFVDDDIRATDNYINSWVQFFENYPETVAAGGKIHVQFDDPRPCWLSHFLLPLLGHHDFGNSISRYRKSKYPFGGNMAFKKEVFDKIGWFDPDLGRNAESLNAGEEKELFKRIRDHGFDIYYLPEAFLFHRAGKERLTIDYIRTQALGLGQSMKLQLRQASIWQYFKKWGAEINKMIFTIALGFFYSITWQYPKAKLLFYFRLWILKGYLRASNVVKN